MENNIRRMYCFDCAILGGLSALLALIISCVLYSLGQVQSGGAVRTAILLAGTLALVFAIMGMATVVVHLKNNSEELYAEYMEAQGIQLHIEEFEGEAI